MAVNQVGLLSDVYCTVLPAGVDGFTWNFFGNTGLEKEQLSNPMIVTDSSFVEDQKCVLVNHGLLVVQGDTASLTNVVGVAIITVWLIYRNR